MYWPEAHGPADSADCGNSEALIGATPSLASGSRTLVLESTQRPVVYLLAQRWTRTGILQCVSTLTVSLPSTSAEMPWRPCEAMTMRSQPFDPAVSMIAW
jgi:hypothetical protein